MFKFKKLYILIAFVLSISLFIGGCSKLEELQGSTEYIVTATIRTVDTEGEDVDGVLVTNLDTNDTKTSSNGRVQFELDGQKSYTFKTQHDYFGEIKRTIGFGTSSSTFTMELERKLGNIRGQIVDEKNNGISNARIFLVDTDRTVSTDSFGYFNFENINIRDEKYNLRIEKDDFEIKLVNEVEITTSNYNKNLDRITLYSDPGMFEGRIRSENGDSIAEVEIDILELGESITTNYIGDFEKELPPGIYTVEFNHSNYINDTRTVEIKSNETRNININLNSRPGRIEGRVLTEETPNGGGEPVGDIEVTIEGRQYSATTLSNGRFYIDDVMPNTYVLEINNPIYRSANVPNINVQSNQNFDVGTIYLSERTGNISGRVLNEYGEPFQDVNPNVEVIIENRPNLTSNVNEAGEFMIYDALIGEHDIRFYTSSSDIATEYRRIEVIEGEVNTGDILLMEKPGSISGTIRGEVTGMYVPNATIRFYTDGDEELQPISSTETGSFIYDNLDTGEYEVYISHPDFGNYSEENIFVERDSNTNMGILTMLERPSTLIGSVPTISEPTEVQLYAGDRPWGDSIILEGDEYFEFDFDFLETETYEASLDIENPLYYPKLIEENLTSNTNHQYWNTELEPRPAYIYFETQADNIKLIDLDSIDEESEGIVKEVNNEFPFGIENQEFKFEKDDEGNILGLTEYEFKFAREGYYSQTRTIDTKVYDNHINIEGDGELAFDIGEIYLNPKASEVFGYVPVILDISEDEQTIVKLFTEDDSMLYEETLLNDDFNFDFIYTTQNYLDNTDKIYLTFENNLYEDKTTEIKTLVPNIDFNFEEIELTPKPAFINFETQAEEIILTDLRTNKTYTINKEFEFGVDSIEMSFEDLDLSEYQLEFNREGYSPQTREVNTTNYGADEQIHLSFEEIANSNETQMHFNFNEEIYLEPKPIEIEGYAETVLDTSTDTNLQTTIELFNEDNLRLYEFELRLQDMNIDNLSNNDFKFNFDYTTQDFLDNTDKIYLTFENNLYEDKTTEIKTLVPNVDFNFEEIELTPKPAFINFETQVEEIILTDLRTNKTYTINKEFEFGADSIEMSFEDLDLSEYQLEFSREGYEPQTREVNTTDYNASDQDHISFREEEIYDFDELIETQMHFDINEEIYLEPKPSLIEGYVPTIIDKSTNNQTEINISGKNSTITLFNKIIRRSDFNDYGNEAFEFEYEYTTDNYLRYNNIIEIDFENDLYQPKTIERTLTEGEKEEIGEIKLEPKPAIIQLETNADRIELIDKNGDTIHYLTYRNEYNEYEFGNPTREFEFKQIFESKNQEDQGNVNEFIGLEEYQIRFIKDDYEFEDYDGEFNYNSEDNSITVNTHFFEDKTNEITLIDEYENEKGEALVFDIGEITFEPKASEFKFYVRTNAGTTNVNLSNNLSNESYSDSSTHTKNFKFDVEFNSYRENGDKFTLNISNPFYKEVEPKNITLEPNKYKQHNDIIMERKPTIVYTNNLVESPAGLETTIEITGLGINKSITTTNNYFEFDELDLLFTRDYEIKLTREGYEDRTITKSIEDANVSGDILLIDLGGIEMTPEPTIITGNLTNEDAVATIIETGQTDSGNFEFEVDPYRDYIIRFDSKDYDSSVNYPDRYYYELEVDETHELQPSEVLDLGEIDLNPHSKNCDETDWHRSYVSWNTSSGSVQTESFAVKFPQSFDYSISVSGDSSWFSSDKARLEFYDLDNNQIDRVSSNGIESSSGTVEADENQLGYWYFRSDHDSSSSDTDSTGRISSFDTDAGKPLIDVDQSWGYDERNYSVAIETYDKLSGVAEIHYLVSEFEEFPQDHEWDYNDNSIVIETGNPFHTQIDNNYGASISGSTGITQYLHVRVLDYEDNKREMTFGPYITR